LSAGWGSGFSAAGFLRRMGIRSGGFGNRLLNPGWNSRAKFGRAPTTFG